MKKMYSINDIGARLGLPSREAPGPRGMSLEYIWDLDGAEKMIEFLAADGADEITLDGHPQAWLACYLHCGWPPEPWGCLSRPWAETSP